MLGAVDRDPHRGHEVPVRVVHQPLGGADPLAGDLERLGEVGVGLVPVGRPRHAVDHPRHAGLLELVGQVGRVRVGAPLRQHAAGEGHPVDGRRREHQRQVRVDPHLAGRREVLDERPLLDRLEGDRVLLVGPRDGLEDVVDPVIGRVDPRQERRPGRPRVGRHRRPQDPPLPPVDQGLQVRQVTPLEQRVEDAPVGAVPSDEQYSWHASRSFAWCSGGECIEGLWPRRNGQQGCINRTDSRGSLVAASPHTEADRPVIIVDTTTTFGDVMLTGTRWVQLVSLCARQQVRVAISTVVLREVARHWKEQADKAQTRVVQGTKSLADLGLGSFPTPAGLEELAIDPNNFLEQQVERPASLGIEILPLPKVDVSELLERDLTRRKPFAPSGKGFRDALGWHSARELIGTLPPETVVYFVSKNYR